MASRTAAVLVAFAAAFTVLRLVSVKDQSATFDEPAHLTAGYAALAHRDYRVDPTHPPFMRMWAALPLLAMGVAPPDVSPIDRAAPEEWLRESTLFSQRFLYRLNDADRLLNAARAAMVFWGVVLGLLLFWWVRELLGEAAAIAALAFYTISPNLAAHTPLVATDLGEAGFFFGAVFLLWRACRSPRSRFPARDVALCAVCFSLAIVTKFSGLLLIPVAAILLVMAVVVRPEFTVKRAAVIAGTLAASALLIVWAVYGFRYAPSATSDWVFRLENTPMVGRQVSAFAAPAAWADAHRLLPNAFTQGFLFSQASARTLPSFLAGEYSTSGWWYYFPFAFMIKTPLSFLALAAAGAVAFLRRRREPGLFDAAFAVLPVAVFGAFAMGSQINIGLRHILPIYPFALLIAAAGARALMTAGRTGRVAFGLIAAAWLVQFGRVYPDTLTFFNPLAGGPTGGGRYLTDSNLDWGQHLKQLKIWMDRRGVQHVNLAYFGSADPAYYGIDCTYLPGTPLVDEQAIARPRLPGYVAISATVQSGVYLPRRWRLFYLAFRDLEPVADLGHTIRVYWVDRWPELPAPEVVDSAYLDALRNLSDSLVGQQWYGHASRLYHRYLVHRPGDAIALGNLGIALISSGQRDRAIEAFRRAAAAAPGDPRTLNNLTLALLDAGLVDEAVREAQRAVALAPRDPASRELLRRAVEAQGKPERPVSDDGALHRRYAAETHGKSPTV